MKLKVLLPYQVFTEIDNVSRIVAETPQGSYGLLPRRLDCVAVLEPGILTYEPAKPISRWTRACWSRLEPKCWCRCAMPSAAPTWDSCARR